MNYNSYFIHSKSNVPPGVASGLPITMFELQLYCGDAQPNVGYWNTTAAFSVTSLESVNSAEVGFSLWMGDARKRFITAQLLERQILCVTNRRKKPSNFREFANVICLLCLNSADADGKSFAMILN